MRSVVLCALLLGAWLVGGRALEAAPPWAALFPFQRVEADPNKAYKLAQEHGPWLILCSTFAGPTAERDAHRLVIELRRDFQLEAFTHAQHYDFTQPETGLGLSRHSTAEQLRPKRMRHFNNVKYDEIAVMVGHFPTVEDPGLQNTLHTIKFARPQALERPRLPGEPASSVMKLADYRELQRQVMAAMRKASGQDPPQRGPMGNAFATLNPLIPPDEAEAGVQLDKLVLDMNRDVQHSLLKCPGKYTVRVATFRGRTTIDQREIERVERSGQMDTRLEEAALKANKLTLALRQRGVEAYEFHDRHESIVCVGNFDSIGTPRADGKTELSAPVLAIMNQYGAQQFNVVDQAQRPAAGLHPKSLGGVTFDVQPWPVLVPRPSLGATYATGPAGWLFR